MSKENENIGCYICLSLADAKKLMKNENAKVDYFCSRCKNIVDKDIIFCPYCGAKPYIENEIKEMF
jgi:rRNA maturation endonuclease Nob1